MNEKKKAIYVYDHKLLRAAARRNGYGWANGVWVAGLRKDLVAAGRKIGVVTVSHWMTGQAVPDAEELGILAGLAGVQVSDLYTLREV